MSPRNILTMEKVSTPIGSYAPDFELPGVDGAVHHLARYLERYRAVGVVFICNHCPYVKLYLDRLKQIQTQFHPQGFTFIGLNPNDAEQFPEDSFENMQPFVANHQLNFPYLRDVTQEVALTFGAEKTPQVFLLNQQGVICYNGAIDDNAQTPEAVKTPYLQIAITEVLQDQPVSRPTTAPVGCSIKWQRQER